MKLNSIQLLRALAAILVVYVHSIDIQSTFTVSFQQNFYFLRGFGGIGVDIFFTISGFIISYVANKYKGIREGAVFLKKRFLRINPFYYFANMILVVLLILTDYPLNWSDIINGCRDMITMIPILNSQTHLVYLLVVGWTLSFEWWFYILFFLLVLFKVNNKVLLFILFLPLLVAIRYIFHLQDFRLVFITNPIILEFLFGVIIYWLYNHIKVSNQLAGLLILLGAVAYLYNIFISYGDISDFTSILYGNSSMKRVLLWGIPSACIVAGCIFYEKNGILSHLWNNEILVLLGNASYAIYLVHIPVFYSLGYVYEKSGFFLNPDLAIFIQVQIAVGVGILFYKKIEEPLLAIFQSKIVLTKQGLALNNHL